MFELNKIRKYPIEKCKNFGYTFCIIFLLITLFFFFKEGDFVKIFFQISLFFLLLTIFFTKYLKIFAFFWEKFGILLGKVFSPIILILVYVITIIPINLILRILNIDLLKRKFNKKINSYWEKRLDDKINFRNQF